MANLASNCYPVRTGPQLTNYLFEDLDIANQAFLTLLGIKSVILVSVNNKLMRMAIQQVIISQMTGSTLDTWLTAIKSHINALHDILNANFPVEDDPVLISILTDAAISHTEMLELYEEHINVD